MMKGIIVSGAGSTIMRLLDMAVAVFLLRWLSLFEYGTYRLSLASYELFASLFLAGLENVVVSDVAGELSRDARKAKSFFSFYVYCMVFVGVVLWALFFLGGDAITGWFIQGNNSHYLKIVSFLFLLAPFETAYKLKFQIFLDFEWGAFFRIFGSIARLAIVILYFFVSSFGVKEALWSVILSGGIPLLIAAIGYRRESLFIFPRRSEIKNIAVSLFLGHGKWALIGDFVNNANQSIRPFIIKAFVGTEAVALISVAQNLISYAKSLFPIRDILSPVLPRALHDPKRLYMQINRATKYATVGYIFLGLASGLGAPLLIYTLFPKYMSSLPIFYILLLGFPFQGFRLVAPPVFYALKEQRVLTRVTVGRTLLLIPLNALFTYFFGIWGAATEMLLLGLLTTPAYVHALHAVLPEWTFQWRDIYSFDDYDRRVLLDIKDHAKEKIKRFLPRFS